MNPTEPPAGGNEPGTTESQKGSTTVRKTKLVGAGKKLRARSRVACDGTNGPCRVTVLLKRSVNTRLLATNQATAKKRTVILGRKTQTIPAAGTRTVLIRLSKAGRKVFAKKNVLRAVKVIARGRDGAGKLAPTIRNVTLKVPRAG